MRISKETDMESCKKQTWKAVRNRQQVPLRTALYCGHMHESFNGRNNMGLILLGQPTILKLISLVLGLQFPAMANWSSSLSDVYIICGSIYEAC